mgnify:FL=1
MKNKEQETLLGIEEEEILNKMDIVEASVRQKIQEMDQRELEVTKFYSEFVISTKNGPVTLKNVYITQEKDQTGNISYHFRWINERKNGNKTIDEHIVIDENRGSYASEELKDYIDGLKINMNGLMKENGDNERTRLIAKSEKLKKEEMEKIVKGNNNNMQKEEKNEEKIGKDIGGDENLQIDYYRQIKDDNLDEQIKKDFSGYEEKGIAYSKTKNAFIMVGKKDGKFQMVDGFEPAQPTFRTVMSIDEKGEKVEKKVPHALMKTSNSQKEMSITIGQYGYIEAGTVDRLPCNERVEMQVREEGETEIDRTSPQLRRAIRTQGTEAVHNWVHGHEEQNENMNAGDSREEDVVDEIENDGEHLDDNKENEYIPGTNKTWRQFANECGYRGEGSIEHAQEIFEKERENPKNEDKSNDELVEDIVDEKNEEFHELNK